MQWLPAQEVSTHDPDAGWRPSRLPPLGARKDCGKLAVALQVLWHITKPSAFYQSAAVEIQAAKAGFNLRLWCYGSESSRVPIEGQRIFSCTA